MAYAFIHINLGDVDTCELIEELEGRPLDSREQSWLLELIKSDEKEKFELLLKIKDKFTLTQLEEMFEEKSDSICISENQLKLFN